jgi:hypothetical protein
VIASGLARHRSRARWAALTIRRGGTAPTSAPLARRAARVLRPSGDLAVRAGVKISSFDVAERS